MKCPRRILSDEDFRECFYISTIEWKRRFSIRRTSSESTENCPMKFNPNSTRRTFLSKFDEKKLRRIQSFPEMPTDLVNFSSKTSPMRSENVEKPRVEGQEKLYSFEIKTNHYRRTVFVKTKHEEQILQRKSTTNDDNDETFDRRPLLNLIDDLHQRQKTVTNQKISEPMGKLDVKEENFDEKKTSLTRRISVLRSHTFNTSTDVVEDQINSSDPLTSQSTPQLNSDRTIISSHQHNSTTNLHLDDKNEILMSDQRSSSFFSTPILHSNSNLYAIRRHHSAPQNESRLQQTKRKAIAMQLYDTEKSYVEALKNLVTKYYLPMKDKTVISNDLLNDIFYKIPEIHIHHTAFLISISQKLSQWDNKQTVGDLFLQTFTKATLIETYRSFVNNYKTAQIAIRLCRDSSSFNKFLEQQARDHRGKLTLRDLIIQPVQRIPRYELYLKDFLKSTNLNHPDYQLLLKAQSEIHSLAEQIDQVQREVGSTDLTLNHQSLEMVQEMIENLNDLVHPDRYYIRHDLVTLQSPTGLKKDRCLFLFNDLILVTSCQRRTATLTKKTNNPLIINSPSGKQYIDNAKHKLIMKISLESIDLPTDQMKKSSQSPSMIKSSSSTTTTTTTTTTTEKPRQYEEDLVILNQINDLAKTISFPHQLLEDSIQQTVELLNKHLIDQSTQQQTNTDESSIQSKINKIQLTLHTPDRTETIDVLFLSTEHRTTWIKSFLQAKKSLFETATGRRNVTFQHVLTLPHSRTGSQFSCGTSRSSLGDICLCNSQGQVCLINIQPDVTMKACNTIISSRITCVAYVPPSNRHRRTGSSRKHRQEQFKEHQKEEKDLLTKSTNVDQRTDSLLDIDSSDDEETNEFDRSNQFDFNDQSILFENDFNAEQQDTREATMWIGTDDGIILIFQCTETIKTVARKSRIVKQLGSAIYSILYTDNKVFVALAHGELAVYRRNLNDQWDLDNPIIQSIDDHSSKDRRLHSDSDEGENLHPISCIALAAGKLWCAIKDRIVVVCPNSLSVQHSFVVDDCHRHISCLATGGGSSMHHVWISSQGSHEIRLYHATQYQCLFETSIRSAVTQKLQMSDDIIRSHKLGCLRVTFLHVCKETLWIGTSAGVLINLTVGQLIDGTMNKLTGNSLQIKGLTFGHAGPVRFILSTDRTTDDGTTMKTLVFTIGDGFEDFTNNDETLGKDDPLSHLIVWQI